METSETSSTAALPDISGLSALSRQELVDKVTELAGTIDGLNDRIKELTTPPPNDWHSLFYSLLHIVLFGIKGVDIRREVVLGAQPPRADFVVVREGDDTDLGLKIFSHFRKCNIIEFKSPDDALSQAVLWKVVGYAGFYIAKYNIPAEDVTLTLFRDARPDKLIKELGKCVEADEEDGIYTLKNWKVDFPIQIVVTSRLKGREYAGFRAVSKKPRIEDVQEVIRQVLEAANGELTGWLRDFLDMFSKLDNEMLEEAKRRYPDMARTWRDIFGIDEEINTAVNTARADERRTNLYLYVQDGDMMIENAARRAGISTDQFRTEMASHGYRVPQAV